MNRYRHFSSNSFVQQKDVDQHLVAYVRFPDDVYYLPVKIPAGSCPVIEIQKLQCKLAKRGGEILHFVQKADKVKP